MKNLSQYLLIFLCISFLSCEEEANTKIIIKGKIDNLPNGKLMLVDVMNQRKRIESALTLNGEFKFELDKKKYPVPIQVELNHFDTLSIKRIISFKTNIEKLSTSSFYLEDGIEMNGNLVDNINISQQIKLVSLNNKIKVGSQTYAYFSINPKYKLAFSILKKEIKRFPKSYHLLYELDRAKHNFTNQEIETLFNLFDEEITESEPTKNINGYILNRDNYAMIDIRLISPENQLIPIIDKNSKMNIVILWASWCGPCRQEIPFLKEIYKKIANEPTFNMVSVSLDSEKENWIKALNFFKMDWQQVIINPDLIPFQKDIFKFDGSIPTILFVDSNGEIIESIRGYDKSNEKKIEEIVNRMLLK